MMRLLLVLYTILLTFEARTQKINGITLVAPPKPIGNEAFKRVKETNANWICLVPYAFQRKGDLVIKFNLEKQWWGETSKGLAECIDQAHKEKFKVMIKPQVYVPGGWTGDINFDNEKLWIDWEKSYSAYLFAILEIAIAHDVEMICIGTELKNSCIKRENYWRNTIVEIREKYRGKLVYSANWDDYHTVNFWDDLDYIGISAYFPLTDMATPTINALKVKWKKPCKHLKDFSTRHKKQILFTEYGYLTTDNCAWKTWELEKNIKDLNQNQKGQANAFEALYLSIWYESFMAGGFIWKWFPNGMGHEGNKDKDYDVQDKKAEFVIKKYYQSLDD